MSRSNATVLGPSAVPASLVILDQSQHPVLRYQRTLQQQPAEFFETYLAMLDVRPTAFTAASFA